MRGIWGSGVKIKACVLLFLTLVTGAVTGQETSKEGWGPWRYTWHGQDLWSGMPFRSKCLSTDSDGDSLWAYQFKSRYGDDMAFVTKTEQAVDESRTNGFSKPEIVTLGGGSLSPVFHTKLHGSCADHKELKIEVMCVEAGWNYGLADDPCYHDQNGNPLDMKQADSLGRSAGKG
jgi:hypothetical protein